MPSARWLAVVVVMVACLRAAIGHAQDARAPEPPPAPPAPGQVTRAPELLQASAPEYPPAALAAGKQAVVKVRINLDDAGVVTSVDVIEPVGDGFDEAAVAAAMQYVFSPAEIDGKPAPISVETAINFVIEQAPAAEPPPPPDAATALRSDGPPNHAGRMRDPVSLQGEVVERGTRSKLAGVTVSIAELGLDAITGEQGDFYFHGLPPGEYRVLAVDDRFDRLQRSIALAAGEQLEVRLWMRPRGGNPYETIVEGAREQLEVTKRTLRREQLTSVPGTFGDPIRVLQSLPGVARTPFGLGLLLIRGSNPDDTGVFIDGHEVPLLFHFLGGPSVLNAEMIDAIDLYPGGFPARFGRHHGGVVAIETRSPVSDGVHGSADVDFLDSGGYLRAPLGKNVMAAVAGRRSYIDVFLPLFLPDNGQVVVPVYYDYQARLDWDRKAEGKLSLTLLGSADTLDVLSNDPDDEDSLNLNSAIRFFRVIGNYRRPLTRTLSLSLSPAYGRDTVTFAGGQAEAAGPFTSLDIAQTALSYRMRVNGRLGGSGLASRMVLDTGLDLLSRVTRYEALVPLNDDVRDGGQIDVPPELTLRGAEELALGLYVDLGIDVTPRLRVVPSLRLDGYNLDGNLRGTVDPRISARLALGQGWTAKGYLGLFSQPPQPEAFDPQFGNPDIGVERGTHYGLGAEWKPAKLWSFDAEAYYIRRDDVVVFENDFVQNDDGTFSRVNFTNEGFRNAYGFEALIRREVSERAYGWLSYTFSKAGQRRGDGALTATNFDQPHTLNAVASWKPGNGFELGARFRLSSGRPETPIEGGNFDADSGGYNSVRGDLRSRRTPTFHQLDVRVERTWLFNTWSAGVYLDVQNVYNNPNVEATRYDYRFRRSAEVTGVPILPTLGVRGQW
jgi:TonB family protein